ncbi:hypothetical protein F5Y04DRAFT_291960 [Hypomontagnella monticulosa]|nr:hypothetical protein F5Y04DRAFT_291960 [Hypomontagnella monticulosa]
MKIITGILAYSLAARAAAAAVVPRSGPVPSGPWQAGVWKTAEGTDVFFWGDLINAHNGKFWINTNVTSYCPSDIDGLDCAAYPGTETIFVQGNGTLFLNVGIPGGQQVYVAEDGSLSYTVPHSGAIPPGANVTGFSRSRSEAFGGPVELFGPGYFNICPFGEGEPREKPYQVFLGEHKRDRCYWTVVRTYQADRVSAWEYL